VNGSAQSANCVAVVCIYSVIQAINLAVFKVTNDVFIGKECRNHE
jgi:hypothetical protein